MSARDCINRIRAAAKRELTDDEVEAIFARIQKAALDIKAGRVKGIEGKNIGLGNDLTAKLGADMLGEGGDALAKTSAEAIQEAAQLAAADLVHEANLKERRAELQVVASNATAKRVEAMKRSGMKITESQAYIRDMQASNNYIHTLHEEALVDLKNMLDAASSRKGVGMGRRIAMWLFDMDNPTMTADVVREIFKGGDGHTGNKIAQAGAKSWLSTIEKLRVRFNNAGGDIGKLGYGYLSQIHDAAKIIKVDAQEWTAKTMGLLDRRQYLDADGRLMNDTDLTKVLEGVHATLASGGLNKIEPGQYMGSGKRANAGSDARVLHFKDGDAWMSYMSQFGEGTLYDAMMGHIGHMTRNIGLVEKYGPDPEMLNRVQSDIAERSDGKGTVTNRSWGNTPQAYWDILSGKTGSPENEAIANGFSNLRNVQTAAKLGGAFISSFQDAATVGSALHYNRLPYFRFLGNMGRQFKAEQREFLQAHGVIAEHLSSTLNRFTGDNMTHSLTGRVANAVMKVSLLNAWTDGWRGAFSATMMQNFAKKVGTDWGSLDGWDQWLMGRKGITQEDWNVIKDAQPTVRNGLPYLTRDSIVATGADNAEQIATKWMAFVSDEAQFAVIQPDMATRAIVTGGAMPAGTFRGEAVRSISQFKSFPMAMLTRHWNRVFDTPQGIEGAPRGYGATTKAGSRVNQIAVLSALGVSSMMLGAIVLQTKALLQGKDPYGMDTGKFWIRSYAQGGGAGFLGDLLTKDPTDQTGTNNEQVIGATMGPAAGSAVGLVYDVGLANIWKAAKDKPTDTGAEALKWANSNVPGANLWETRALWEHWFLNNAQEALNPGYLGRMKSRAMRDWQQDYYWQPGEALPSRPPNLARATGH